ncbi:hypothetical protein N6G06_07535 [Cupriavidus gilardii]|uniref:hypothetical protein n=1 Tax=Cupriavidus gilardii TaxID=82541 RepID=UPI0021BFEF6E|nr:hypothetical protein [Cupriavidus gilardii]MCT9071214.1 hypothetical protein [Cupriavidus gilardii]
MTFTVTMKFVDTSMRLQVDAPNAEAAQEAVLDSFDRAGIVHGEIVSIVGSQQ